MRAAEKTRAGRSACCCCDGCRPLLHLRLHSCWYSLGAVAYMNRPYKEELWLRYNRYRYMAGVAYSYHQHKVAVAYKNHPYKEES
jgi:hypothetical protein